MEDLLDHQHRRRTIWDLDIVYILPILVFIFMSLFPGQALAFEDELEQLNAPLVFVYDPSLAGKAVVGIDAFTRARTANELLQSNRSQIPSAPQRLVDGTVIRTMATGYSSSADQTDSSPFITASGTTVHTGTLAANFLPFGTRVRVGNMIYTVEDRMNSRYNGRYIVDIWFPSREAARQFGVRVLEMEVMSVPGK